MKLLVVIVNYKTAGLCEDCLDSLAEEIAQLRDRATELKVVVTDNASGDGSVDRLQNFVDSKGYANWCEIKPLPRNGGFAYGNNGGIRPALKSDSPPDYVLLLNPDTIVRPRAISELVLFMEQRPEVGITGSRLEDPDGTPQRSAFRFPGVLSEFEFALRLGPVSKLLSGKVVAPPVSDVAVQTDWVAGASMLVRREVFDKAGLMDEHYFMYYEEVDFCKRAAEAGFECWYVPASRVVHLVGQASGVTDAKQARKRRPSYWFESRRRYMLKNLGGVRTMLADSMFMGAFATWRVRRLIQRKPDPDPAKFLTDFASQSVFRRGFARAK